MSLQQTEINTGKTGAKRQSFRNNPRTVLLKLIAEHPHESRQDEKEILEMLWERVSKNETMMRTICEYWGVNNYRSIVYAVAPRNQLARTQEVELLKESIAAKIVLMDWILPNGKKLRDCTKHECVSFGGWLVAVARKLKKGETVGQRFSEAQLHAFMKGEKS